MITSATHKFASCSYSQLFVEKEMATWGLGELEVVFEAQNGVQVKDGATVCVRIGGLVGRERLQPGPHPAVVVVAPGLQMLVLRPQLR